MTLKLGKNNYKNNYLFIGLLHNISQSYLCCRAESPPDCPSNDAVGLVSQEQQGGIDLKKNHIEGF